MEQFNILAQRLKALRREMNMTQVQFAKKMGFTQATLSAYENSQKKPSLDIVMDIAKKCEVSLDWLCGLRETKRETLEFTNYRDAALIILKLIEIDIMTLYEAPITKGMIMPPITPSKILCCELKRDIKELNDFFQTYIDLFHLELEGKIKHSVIDAWLLASLEELATIPICTEIPYEELDDPPQD